ncbi:F0F1 ATP synthase subunit epsilon [Sphingosinicella soli]|uniref:ATP synthase epsilon chain n=1 Tax=Sphingosinicella soli TaxID=333708 RepID=A0A7W7F6G9_9SPHN|nr:F0F1 ATP synthase subunit epsilon [Sphingosinicella soli]MBB4631729.1 F-type H+-transporting ATPase subunit epsilon [Sphingosinicella soli]
MADLHFELVSPERLLRSGDVHMVVVPGTEGDFGVLAGHAPFMSTIRPGAIDVYETANGPATRIFIDGGFAEVNDKGLTILAENAVPIADIKADEVSKMLAAAREDGRLAKTEGERIVAEKLVARYEAMQAAAAN